MTASSGGGRYRDDDDRSPLNTIRESAGTASSGRWREARSLDEFLPDRGDQARSRDMQATWLAFCLERYDRVRRALDSGRTTPEIAYQLGEMVHTYFHPRGVTLTGQELRRLVAELLDPPKSSPVPTDSESRAADPSAAMPAATGDSTPPRKSSRKPPPSSQPTSPPVSSRAAPPENPLGDAEDNDDAPPSALVSFRGAASERAGGWTGDEQPQPVLALSDSTFEAPPSPLVTVTSREAAEFDRLLGRTLEIARPRLGGATARVGRDEALRAIDAALDEVLRGKRKPALAAEAREGVVLAALGEICGLGLIDRLWADRGVHAVFVNGPKAVFVERAGGLEPAAEVFRDEAQLLELVGRLADRPESGVAQFERGDGCSGTVIFPPAAPDGPVLTIRRADPANVTLDQLIAGGLLDDKTATLLRVVLRARLKLLVMGPAGAGKTALLAALARDLDAATRVVTLSRHRVFRWAAPGKVELVASREQPYAVLLAAAEQLRPDILVIDSLDRAEAEIAAAALGRGARGAVVACETAALAPELLHAADLVARLDRGRDGVFRVLALEDATGSAIFVHEGGQFQRRSGTPAFAEKVRAAGHGEALAALLR